MMPRYRSLALLIFAILAACPLFAQTQTAPPATPAADTKAVTMGVTVRDKHGAIVSDLTKDDFTLTEDGRPQTIKGLTHDSSLPLTLGLLVDTDTSERNTLDAERTASQSFLNQMLTGAPDRAFLIQFDREVDLIADVSADKGKLHSAIDQLGAPQFQNTSSSQDADDTNHRLSGGGTMLYDAIYLASSEVMKKQAGRKDIIVLTDGVDRGSKETLFSAIEAAQRANTVVYAIYIKGEDQSKNNNNNGYPNHRRGGMGNPGGGYPGGGYPGGGGGWPGGGGGGNGRTGRPTEGSRIDGRKVLEQICSETGGYMFQADKKKDVNQNYSAIADELRAQYILDYTPDKQSADSGYHKVLLTAKKKGLFVQTRQGYYGGD